MAKGNSAPIKPARRKILQDKMIDLIASGLSQQKTADILHVNVKTVKTWLKLPGMADILLEAVDEVVKQRLGPVMNTMYEKAEAGSHNHARVMTEWLNKSMDRKNKQAKDAMDNEIEQQKVEFAWKD